MLMPGLVRRVLLFAFVLLQALSPLLHAHAGAVVDHGGIHMPQGDILPISPLPTIHGQASEEPPAITVEACLAAKDSLPVPGTASLRFHQADPFGSANPRWVPTPSRGPIPPLISHLIPHPGAPPAD